LFKKKKHYRKDIHQDLMQIMPINKIVLFILICSVFTGISCSSHKIKELSTVELAQRLIRDQQTGGAQVNPAVKIHFIQPEKAVIGKQMEIELELVPLKAHPSLTVVYQADEGLKFSNRWLFLQQDTITRILKDVQEDRIYRQKVNITPVMDGLLKLNVYVLSEENKQQKASLHTITFSIGDALKEDRSKRITL
jgi:hypothetical protein